MKGVAHMVHVQMRVVSTVQYVDSADVDDGYFKRVGNPTLRSFGLASTRLCRRTLTENNITVADLLLVQVCKSVHRFLGMNL